MDTYEKKYKEALERASNLHKDAVEMEDNQITKICEIIFPELKASDERIRKELICFLETEIPHCNARDKYIAWLEKQDEKKSSLPKWRYKRDNTPLLRDSLVLNKYGCVLKALSGAIISDAWILDYAELAELPREEPEKQDEQNHCMIQWKGDNLKEVIDFTGKDKNFEKWFKSFEEYEKYVQEHDGIFKLFNADGSHYEVPVGAWIVKTPDGYNVASKAVFKQKFGMKVKQRIKMN